MKDAADFVEFTIRHGGKNRERNAFPGGAGGGGKLGVLETEITVKRFKNRLLRVDSLPDNFLKPGLGSIRNTDNKPVINMITFPVLFGKNGLLEPHLFQDRFSRKESRMTLMEKIKDAVPEYLVVISRHSTNLSWSGYSPQ